MRHDGRDAEEDAAHDRQHRHDVAVKSVQLLFPAHDVEEHRNIECVERDDRQLGRVEAKRAEPALGEVGAVEICQPDGAHEHAHDGGVCRHVRVLVDAEERLRLRAVAARGDGVEAARRGEHEPVERAEAQHDDQHEQTHAGGPALPATPAWILPKEYAGFSPAEKLGQLRAKLAELGCTAQLVGKLDNLAWLLNLRAMDIECTPYAMAYCYVTPDRAVLFIHTARVTPEAKAELEANGVTLAEYDRVLDFMAAETEPQTVLAESATVNYAVYQVLENNAALTVKDLADPLLPMKGVKNEVELTHDKEAHLRDAVAMVRFQIELEKRLEAGEELTELTVDQILHKYRSATDKFIVESFGTIAAYGGNAAMMHYHATPEDHAKLQRKGFLLVDSGATYMDGTTDITRTYPLGELTEDERKFYTWTLQCHIDIAKAVWLDYCDCHMIDTIAREPLWQHLINYRCGTGHSVSFVGNVHEGPHALNGRNTTLMRPGMIVTDEPGVYETDLVGIRIENELVCVHKADNQYGTFLGFEPIMFVPIATSPIVPGVLTKDELDWLNNYHRQVFEKLAPRLNDEEREWLAKKCAAIGC